jgi:hypothetical protein
VGAKLVLGARLRATPQLLHAARELVAQRLQLLQAEQARARARWRAGSGGEVGEAVSDDRRQLALQARDLRAQRAPGRPLADLCRRGRARKEWSIAIDR